MAERINNYNTYIYGMRKTLEDKLFWYDLVQDYDTVVDFGCADGSLLKALEERNDKTGLKKRLVGIDNNEVMLDKARENVSEGYFYSSFKDFIPKDYTLLNLSSVIHEVYSYCSQEEIDKFWYNVFNKHYRYIAIRDMMISKSIYDKRERPSYWIPLEYQNQFEDYCIKRKIEGGPTCAQRIPLYTLEFYLKYRYVENWERESRENYFPIYLEELLEKIPVGYEIMYLDHYILPYAKTKTKEDMGVDIVDNTHCKILLKRTQI